MKKVKNIVVLPPVDNYSPLWPEYYAMFPEMHRSVGADGDNGGDGDDSGNNSGNISAEELQQMIETKAAELAENQTASLKSKNEELLSKLSDAKKKLEPFKDQDIDSISGMLKVLEQSEDAKLIADGKLDEVIAKKTDKIVAEANEKLETLQSQLDQKSEGEQKYKSLYESKIVSDELMDAAIKHGVSPDAFDDVNMRGSQLFKLGEDGKAEARDKNGKLSTIKVGDSDVILTADRFVESLKTTHSHYFGSTDSGGLGGSRRNSSEQDQGANLVASASSSNFDIADYRKRRTAVLNSKK